MKANTCFTPFPLFALLTAGHRTSAGNTSSS